MRRPPTIYDVAERAGVSKSLVSLVLRDSPRVSDEKRAAVLAAVAELDYTPSRLAAGLAGSRTRGIGVVIDEFENLWFAPVLAGLRAALGAGGYSLSVADASLNAHLGLDPLEVFRSLRVDGVVLAGDVSADALERLTVPAVVLGTRALRPPGAPVVASDELGGGRIATAHLAELGHRDIVCVTGPGASAAARETGYLAEMRDRGLAPRVLRAAQTSEAAARTAAGELFEAADPAPSAVFAVNDPMAVGVIGSARDRGIEVPRALSVVGYDDSPLAAYELIALTSVSGDPRELGEAAGRALAELLEGADDPAPAGLLAPNLVVRRSTAPPGDSSVAGEC
ncbi:LacI family DNA-binding transcriptional regulator [Leucobacter sp. wl10]|uniref:LacI family DNA-binding transcriptional regulator n=1 Tax=Leucobacter sp. wl10 TaxID=2304677 RepID=UPI000E5B61E9|nr:LacI family DNA-binding transcriptional regulator [Leucobacter sp. wl10]RGE20706.1 LacI family transcriptional regulator [Leucobacter sp. wl10]